MPNGSATVFPYPLVTIFPVIPVPSSPIGETDDSFYEILVHEYTHILNLYPVHGLPRGLSWIFGSIVRPNAYLPRWYAEGLAVFTESYFVPKGGRLRSQNFEGLMRSIGENKSWDEFEIDQLNDSQPDWFGGRRAYLLGGALMHDVATKYGLEGIYKLNDRYSRRIPYFLKAPAKDHTGKGWDDLLTETYVNLQNRIDDQLKLISMLPTSSGQRIPGQGFHNLRPLFSPDGNHMAFLSRDHDTPSVLQLITRAPNVPLKDSKPQVVTTGIEMEHMAWSNDSKFLAYNNIENYKRFYVYSDIYMFELATKKSWRLTHGARAGDLAFSPDDQHIYFVQNIPGSKQISKINVVTKQITVLYTPPHLGTNLYSLIQHNGRVYFIEQYMEKRTLRLFDLASNTISTLNENIQTTRLRTTKEGIMLTSSQSGVDNLYLIKELNDSADLKTSKPLTNSKTRVLDGDIDPLDRTLYYSEQHDDGIFIFAETAEQWAKIKTVPQVKPLLDVPLPPPMPADQQQTFFEEKPEEDYSVWPYMIPRYWMPFGYVLDGGMGFTASTGAADPLGKHAYNVMAEWDTLTERTGLTVDYINNTTPIEITASASQVYRYNYSGNGSVLKDTGGMLGGNFNVPFMNKSWTSGINWKQSETELRTRVIRRGGPGAYLSYNSAIRRGYQVVPLSGSGFSISHQKYIEDIGNVGYDKTNISARKFFGLWAQHALMFQINGTYAPDLQDPQLFTSTIGGNYFTNQLIPPFLVRGYDSGTVLGKNMGTVTAEYRFPIANVFKGYSTIPFFVRQISGGFVADAVTLDGLRFNVPSNGYLIKRFGDEWLVGYGVELDINATLGYYLPVTLSFGLYKGAEETVSGDDLSYFFMFRF